MMTVTLDRIIRDYLALRGESPDLLPELEEGEDSAVLTLARALTVRLPEAAVEAVRATPRLELEPTALTGVAASSGAPQALRAATPVLTIRLPSDYLLFYSLRMQDWSEPLTALEPEGTLRRALGARAPAWMVCRHRPMAVEERDAEGRYLKVYGTEAAEQPYELLYVRRPAFDGVVVTLPEAAYGRLLAALA